MSKYCFYCLRLQETPDVITIVLDSIMVQKYTLGDLASVKPIQIWFVCYHTRISYLNLGQKFTLCTCKAAQVCWFCTGIPADTYLLLCIL